MNVIFNKSIKLLKNKPKGLLEIEYLEIISENQIESDYISLEIFCKEMSEQYSSHSICVYDKTTRDLIKTSQGLIINKGTSLFNQIKSDPFRIKAYRLGDGKIYYFNARIFIPFYNNPELIEQWQNQ